MADKISSFQDLYVWQNGHELVLEIYTITRKFPRSETYSLVDQMRRAAISVTSNIAEGFGRRSLKEKNQFYNLSMGSLTELENQLIVAKDLKYMTPDSFIDLTSKLITIKKMLNKLISVIRNSS